MQKQTAVVKWFSNQKGYGYLTTPEGDRLVHHSDIEPDVKAYKTLKTGEHVEYLPVTTDTGLAASDVYRIRPTLTPWVSTISKLFYPSADCDE